MIKEPYPSKLLSDATDALGSLPGVGRRSALRLALHLLRQPSENVHHFADAIVRLRDEAGYCPNCMMLCDGEVCPICSDRERDHRTICVVESIRDVISIENSGQYWGVYHVLGGVISPLEGIGVSDITANELFARLAALVADGGPQPEVIFALSGTVEGETTTLYIHNHIAGMPVKITSLARGLGFEDDLEYADEVSLGRAILHRQPLKI
ncbi:MAG: recombination protein RecR [Bacteroidales bacterium]|nr:recombination protein RecR [Bacteroidales bacterium]MBR0298223.1 recombination protein RecR [Bacteroidales bacterium]